MRELDVLIVGGGSAGATAAWKCRQRGLNVRLVEAKSRERAGAAWVNGVEARLFPDLDLGPATAPVVFHRAPVFHLEAPGGARVSCRRVPTVEVHMGHLNEHLLNKAEQAGAQLDFERELDSLLVENGTVRGARFRSGRQVEPVRAAVTVDATGVDGAVREKLPPSIWEREAVVDADICVAAQQVRQIIDKSAASAFLEKHRVRPGETLCWAGLAGGYSILNVTVDLEAERVSFLTGAMLAEGQQAAVRLVDLGVDRVGFAGSRIFGGGGLVPVRRAFDRLVGPGYALLGTAACQVFPPHGSGVAAGMRAADILAGVVADVSSNGAPDTAGLWPYAVAYQRHRGALCASQEPVARFSATLESRDIEQLVGNGAISGGAVEQSLDCQPLRLSPRQLWGTARTAAKAPGLAARMLATAAKVARIAWHYRHYPESWEPGRFAEWRATTARLFPGM